MENKSFFGHESDDTIVSSSPNHGRPGNLKSVSDNLEIPHLESIRNSVRHSLLGLPDEEATKPPLQVARETGNRSARLNTSQTNAPIRRSTRLSVAPRPVYFESPRKKEFLLDVKKPKLTKKATRFSTRLSILPQSSPGRVQFVSDTH